MEAKNSVIEPVELAEEEPSTDPADEETAA